MDVDLDRMQREARERRRRWDARATYLCNPQLPLNTWIVDGETQEGELNEAALEAATAQPAATVVVGKPLDLVLGRIIGYVPPVAEPA